MSILLSTPDGWIISHGDYLSLTVPDMNRPESTTKLKLNPKLFEINVPFKSKLKAKKTTNTDDDKSSPSVTLSDLTLKIVEASDKLIALGRKEEIFKTVPSNLKNDNNKTARETATKFYEDIKNFLVFPRRTEINESEELDTETILFDSAGGIHRFFVPRNSVMHSDSVENLLSHLDVEEEKFSLVIMDPPWWNKYVRRRKRKQKEAGYAMMENVDIRRLPIDRICQDGALVVVWCTNSSSHQIQLINQFFPIWGVQYVTTWYWLKVTREGVPVCPFNADTQKQPFETIILGRKHNSQWFETRKEKPADELLPAAPKVVISIPSSIHSHKPPLLEILRPYIQQKGGSSTSSLSCCELFARYGLHGFTSLGNEVFKLMHSSLYVKDE